MGCCGHKITPVPVIVKRERLVTLILIIVRSRPKYIEHTLIGDPLAEELADDLFLLSPEEQGRLIEAGMNRDEEALKGAPASLRRFFEDAETPPDWLDFSAFEPGVRMFQRNSKLVLVGFVAGVLIEGFTTTIAKSFFITGRVRDQGIRRLQQNNRHMMDIFLPGGLERDGDGWRLSVRIRIIHGRMRRLLTQPRPQAAVSGRSSPGSSRSSRRSASSWWPLR